MCLGVPGRVLEIDGLTARVEFWGVEREVRLDIVDSPVAPGDYVLNHVGFAIRRIPEEEVEDTLALYDQILEELEREDQRSGTRPDLMAAEVRGEIAGDAGVDGEMPDG
jgi:hydrogenase expression/formation protein HypC